uniref:Uncharacterized protein n=1 Tax=Leersia perrieri TaxID=77586 RepID=A0A0D9WB39_9ORYZ
MGDPSFPDKLQGLALLPLANGSFTAFNNRGEGERVFFTSQMEFDLLKDSIHLVVDNSIPDGILKKLYGIACSARSNIYLFTCNFLLELLPRILPPEWQHAKQLSWSPGQQGVHEDLLNESFIRTESAKEKSILVSYFAVWEPQKAEFYKDHVLPRISEFLSQPAVVSAILCDVKLLMENDNSVRAALYETPFVLAASGAWVHPSRFVNLKKIENS